MKKTNEEFLNELKSKTMAYIDRAMASDVNPKIASSIAQLVASVVRCVRELERQPPNDPQMKIDFSKMSDDALAELQKEQAH